MSKRSKEPYLAVSDEFLRGGFYIAWFDEEEGEGGSLGQDEKDGEGETPSDPLGRDHWVASKAVRAHGFEHRGKCGFEWSTRAAANRALTAVKAALKADKLAQQAGRPFPDWAQKALEAGWKPPKGWKP